MSFPGGSGNLPSKKETACNASDVGFIPGLGRSPGEGNGNPLWYSWLGNLWTEEPGGLESMRLQVGHDLVTKPHHQYIHAMEYYSEMKWAIKLKKKLKEC